jgi:REP element-mobilizing transposase RayT
VPRILRSHLDDGFFHVTARGNRGSMVFVDDLDRIDFLQLLRTTRKRFEWRCLAHCLLGTHYHLIIEASQENLSSGMQRLNGVYARRFNRRHGYRGHVFEDRFASFVIEDEPHLQAAVAYVHQNPVRAGLCNRAEEWRWSG